MKLITDTNEDNLYRKRRLIGSKSKYIDQFGHRISRYDTKWETQIYKFT